MRKAETRAAVWRVLSELNSDGEAATPTAIMERIEEEQPGWIADHKHHEGDEGRRSALNVVTRLLIDLRQRGLAYQEGKGKWFASSADAPIFDPRRELNVVKRNNKQAVARAKSSLKEPEWRGVESRQTLDGIIYCRGCGAFHPLNHRAFFHLDHIEPLSKGGPDIIANLQLLCAACNIYKRDKWTNEELRERNLKRGYATAEMLEMARRADMTS